MARSVIGPAHVPREFSCVDTLQGFSQRSEHSEALFRMLLETAYDGVVIIRDGVIIEVSRALLAASGYGRDELIGRPVTDFIAEEFRDAIRQREAEGAEGRLVAFAVVKDGGRLIVEVVTRSFVIDGRPTRISALRDVTEKRRLDAQLQQAQKMAALGRLASGIAHDFNNVLSVVRCYGDILIQDLPERHRGDAREIVKAADAGAALARQLLTFSRQQVPSPTTVDFNILVNESREMLGRIIGREIELVTDLAADLEAVNADSSQMQQILLNLAINGRDAMPDGGRLTIKTRVVGVADAQTLGDVPAPGRYVMLAVSDSGIGMSDEVKAQIFEPFFSTKPPDRGTGLGLAIVRGIVESSKGFILVDSTIGVGSTFAIYLPAVGPASAA